MSLLKELTKDTNVEILDDLEPNKTNALYHLDNIEQCLYSYIRNFPNLNSKNQNLFIGDLRREFNCIRKFIKEK